MKNARLLVGLPAYNEEAVLEELLGDLQETLEADGVEYEILVVDDASTDRTPEILRRAAERMPLFAVRHEHNQNLGGAMRTLFDLALQRGTERDILVCMDADNTFRPAKIQELVTRLDEADLDLVVASRYTPGGGSIGVPWYRRLLSLGANRLFRALFPIPGVHEYTCSFRAYRLALLGSMRQRFGDRWITEDGFTSMPEILVRLSRLPLKAAEVPIQIRYDLKVGSSKMKVMSNIFRTLGLLGRMRRELHEGQRQASTSNSVV